MRILLIKFKNIGDTLILTPTIRALRDRYPDAEIWAAVRAGADSILAGCAGIDRIITGKPPRGPAANTGSTLRHGLGLWQVFRRGFDFAFELGGNSRGRWLALLSRARLRATATWPSLPWVWSKTFNHRVPVEESSVHQVEKDFQVVSACLPLSPEIPPLQFSRQSADFSYVREQGLDHPVVIHPATRWKRKQWPLDRWIELTRQLAPVAPSIVLSSGPEPAEIEFCQAIRAQVPSVRFTGGQLSWAQMAGLFYSARLFVGVDTAAMHLAAACQLPLIALFGPSYPPHWRPWRVRHELVTPRNHHAVSSYLELKMGDIPVEDVLAACHKIGSSSAR